MLKGAVRHARTVVEGLPAIPVAPNAPTNAGAAGVFLHQLELSVADFLIPARDVVRHFVLGMRPLERHRADGSPHWAGREWTVELAEAPLDSGEAVRVATVEPVLVVEVQQPGERLRVGRRPGDDRLAPQHAHDIVHLSRLEQLALPRVPDGVVRRRAVQLIQRVRHLALVTRVRVHGSVHPVRKCRQRAVIRITQAEVERQLAPREHFVQERVALFGRRVGAHGAHDVEWRYHPVVEIRRESARAAIVRGIAPPFRIIEQAVADEPVQLRARMRQSALRGHRAHVMIDLAAGDFRGDVAVRDVQPLDTQRGEERGRHAALGRPIVDRLDGEFHQLGDLGPNGASGVLLLVERGGRNDAHRIHGEHSTVHPSREALRPFSHPGGGEEIGHHERRARREAIEHSAIVIQSAAQREAIRQPQRCRADRQLPRTLHDEGVEARRRVGIAGVEPLMDQ